MSSGFEMKASHMSTIDLKDFGGLVTEGDTLIEVGVSFSADYVPTYHLFPSRAGRLGWKSRLVREKGIFSHFESRCLKKPKA